VVDLREGRSRPWEVTLSPIEAEALRRRIAAAELATLPGTLEGGPAVLVVAVRDERALVTRCTSAGCAEPEVRASAEIFDPLSADVLTGDQVAVAWAEGLEALGHDPFGGEVPSPPRPWWRRGSTWVAAALGAVVVGVALGFSLRPDVRQENVIIVGQPDWD